MKIDDFINRFTIEPIDDIEPNFKLTKTFEINARDVIGCYNCGNENNSYLLKSEPWTIVQLCVMCKHINVVYVQDRMSGVGTDLIKCYTEY